MTIGAMLVSAGLVAIASIESEAGYLVAWAVLGVGMRACLYDAAFAALVQVVPSRGRRAISYLTLFGAFASTVFWVVGHYFNEALGWRDTLLAFAAINLAVCLPATEAEPLEGRARTVGIVLFGIVMSLNAFVFGVVTVQLVPLLEAAGLATAAAVWIASLKGFAQFGGRVVEIVFGRKLKAMTVARIAIGVLPVSFALLYVSNGQLALILAFTLLMGASQGVITIVRGAVPLALFGAKGYGAVLGLLATPILIVNAGSAPAFALIAERWGWHTAQLGLFAIAAASWLAMELMTQWYRRHTGH
jgi:hypothetical protein